MSRLRLATAVLPLVALVCACCFMGAPPPPAGATAPEPTATPVPPTPGHTCHLDVDVHFAPTKDDGTPWDVGDGAPDPFVVVRQDGRELARTAQAQDTFSAHWAFDVACEHTRPLDVDVLDRDLSFDDPAFEYTIEPDSDSVVSPIGETVDGILRLTRS